MNDAFYTNSIITYAFTNDGKMIVRKDTEEKIDTLPWIFLGCRDENDAMDYENSIWVMNHMDEYKEKTFEGATSLTVKLDYQTESANYDYIYLYDSTGKQYGKYGGTTRKTETITIPGNYIKILFHTNGSSNNYYGYKATITPNYD